MKKLKIVLLVAIAMLFYSNGYSQRLSALTQYSITQGRPDTVIIFIAETFGSDDHAIIIVADTTDGSANSGGTVPTYTFTIEPVIKVRANDTSAYSLYYNGTSASVQIITSSAVPADSARIWTITPTVVPINAMKVTITFTGLGSKAHWNVWAGYVGRYSYRKEE